jgi:hypothetical protein
MCWLATARQWIGPWIVVTASSLGCEQLHLKQQLPKFDADWHGTLRPTILWDNSGFFHQAWELVVDHVTDVPKPRDIWQADSYRYAVSQALANPLILVGDDVEIQARRQWRSGQHAVVSGYIRHQASVRGEDGRTILGRLKTPDNPQGLLSFLVVDCVKIVDQRR